MIDFERFYYEDAKPEEVGPISIHPNHIVAVMPRDPTTTIIQTTATQFVVYGTFNEVKNKISGFDAEIETEFYKLACSPMGFPYDPK